MRATDASARQADAAQDPCLETRLSAFEVFQGLLPRQVGLLVGLTERTCFQPGDVIAIEGQTSDVVHCVISGEVERLTTLRGEPVILDMVGPGAVFPMAGLLGLPAAPPFTCVAKTAVETVTLGHSALAALLAEEPQAGWRLAQGAVAQITRESSLHVRQLAQSVRTARAEHLQHAEDETNARLERLLLASRLTGLAYATSRMAHDVNNALTSVIGYTDWILTRDKVDGTTHGNLKIVLSEAQRASRAASTGLQSARGLAYKRTSTSVTDAITSVVALREGHLRAKRIDLRLDLAPDLPPVYASPDQLRQLFLNLILMGEQSVSAATGRRVLRITARLFGRNIEVTFADNGFVRQAPACGAVLSPNESSPLGEGTGAPELGVCEIIAREHEGTIRVQHMEGKGSTVTVELPAEKASDYQAENGHG